MTSTDIGTVFVGKAALDAVGSRVGTCFVGPIAATNGASKKNVVVEYAGYRLKERENN